MNNQSGVSQSKIKNLKSEIKMKKQLTITARRCIIAMLIFPFWGLGGLYATVTITPLSVDYPNKKVTFRVAWTGTPANDQVWVWVDLCPVTGTSPGTFAKAVISEPTGSGVVAGTLNGRGFYVNVPGATVTATLSNADGKFNWCAYGSDFPPNAIETSGTYTLKGSPPVIITTAYGTAEVSARTYTGGTITALTDATGCPGVLCGKNGESAGLLNCCVTGTTNCEGTCMNTCTPGCASCLLMANGPYVYALVAGSAQCVLTTTLCNKLGYYQARLYEYKNEIWVLLTESYRQLDCGCSICVNCN
jgi:hypothetical protein